MHRHDNTGFPNRNAPELFDLIPTPTEKVLAVPHLVIEQALGSEPFKRMKAAEMYRLFQSQFFGERDRLETDSRYKQVIPYILIRRGDDLLCYERQGSEKRLTGLLSIGIGGHVNPGDSILSAAYRELREEVNGVGELASLRLAGLLNEDETNVGRHHIGVIYNMDVPKKVKLQSNESALRNLHFESAESLYDKRANMELWSRLCLENLSTII